LQKFGILQGYGLTLLIVYIVLYKVHNAGHTSLNRTLTSNEADRANAAREKWSSDIVSRSRFRSTLDFAADETGLYICSFPIRGFPLSLFQTNHSIFIFTQVLFLRVVSFPRLFTSDYRCVCVWILYEMGMCVLAGGWSSSFEFLFLGLQYCNCKIESDTFLYAALLICWTGMYV